MNLTAVSRFIALILRHHPEKINMKLNEHGWANITELVKSSAPIFEKNYVVIS